MDHPNPDRFILKPSLIYTIKCLYWFNLQMKKNMGILFQVSIICGASLVFQFDRQGCANKKKIELLVSTYEYVMGKLKQSFEIRTRCATSSHNFQINFYCILVSAYKKYMKVQNIVQWSRIVNDVDDIEY